MSDSDTTGFGKFVPGFDFLQSLAKGASSSIPQMPNLARWIAPTLNVEELEKRIEELKGVHFWLEQNSRALGATIQALEVQKMTLATLKGMNFNMGDVANALKLKAADSVYSGVQKVSERVTQGVGETSARASKGGRSKGKGSGSLIDPLQLWGSLTQQFQQIASNAIKEAGTKAAIDTTRHVAKGLAKEAIKGARRAAANPAAKLPRKRAAAAGPASKKAPVRRSS